MTALAAAVFASQAGVHLVDRPRDERFARFLRTFDETGYLRRLAELRVSWVACGGPSFPARLSAIHDPPLGLFVRGATPLELDGVPAVAIVGARVCSGYGSTVARELARDLAAAGVIVVSGLARGIDGEAHRGALAAGTTLAVLGSGIDRDYPRMHAGLAREIAAAGWIVSEYAPGVEPAPWRFPARNRIVAGLADVTVVVEARERSGALITADFALDEGREVMAVPGEITSRLSAGANHLLRLGAAPVTCADDVLQVLGVETARPSAGPLEATLEAVRTAVADAPAGVDELVRRIGLDPARVAAALAELELLGIVSQDEGRFRAVPRAP